MESGVAVLLLVLEPTLPVALDCVLASGVVELEAEVLGDVLDADEFCDEELISEDELLAVCGGVELLFGVLLVLFGLVVLELPVVPVALPLVLDPALPEMLPAVFWSEALGVELAAAPPALEALALETVRSSFTFFTPATDFAIFLACFLSSLLATLPARVTVPLSTVTWTFCRAGLVASCSCTWRCRVSSSTMAFLLSSLFLLSGIAEGFWESAGF